jgi:5-methyltetrahydropteroyltriglutamate--homocysteine methyltransferase
MRGCLPTDGRAPASLIPELKDKYYKDDEEYVFALAEALREEYRTITQAGLIVQMDDAWLSAMYERIAPPGTPEDYRRWAHLHFLRVCLA